MTTIIVSHYNHNLWEDHRHLLPHPGLPGSSRTTSNLSPPLATFVHSALNYPSICFCAVLMMVLQIIELGKKVSPPWPSAKTSKTSGTCRSIFCPLGLVESKILHNHGLRLHTLHPLTYLPQLLITAIDFANALILTSVTPRSHVGFSIVCP